MSRPLSLRLAGPWSLGAAFVLAAATSASAQLPIFTTHHSPNNDPDYGKQAVGLGDVDGDGVPDYAVAETDDDAFEPTGSVFVYSGATGAILYTLMGIDGADNYGISMAAIDDVDQDGVRDLLIGAPDDQTAGSGRGRVELRSGADGSFIRESFGLNNFDILGKKVEAFSDHDGDGVGDYLVLFNSGIFLNSGADGSLLLSIGNPDSYQSFPESAADAGDMNGDGVPDLVIGEISHHVGSNSHAGTVIVRSGATGQDLWKVTGTDYQGHLGRDVAGGRDLNGDGIGEILAGANGAIEPGSGERAGSVTCYDGATGAVLMHDFGDTDNIAKLGWVVSFVDDANGDGVDDYVGLARYSGTVGASGYVRFYSGADHSLLAEIQTDEPYDFFGECFAELGDVNGDRLPDFLVGAKGSRDVHLLTLIGAQRFGDRDEPGQLLELDWVPSAGPDPTRGKFFASQGQPGALGFHLLGPARLDSDLRGLSLFVDLGAPGARLDFFFFDGSGEYSLPELSLRIPALDGIVVHNQILSLDDRAPHNASASNGLAVILSD